MEEGKECGNGATGGARQGGRSRIEPGRAWRGRAGNGGRGMCAVGPRTEGVARGGGHSREVNACGNGDAHEISRDTRSGDERGTAGGT